MFARPRTHSGLSFDWIVDIETIDTGRGTILFRIMTGILVHYAAILNGTVGRTPEKFHDLREVRSRNCRELIGKLDIELAVRKILHNPVEQPAHFPISIRDLQNHSGKSGQRTRSCFVGQIIGEPSGPTTTVLVKSSLTAFILSDPFFLGSDVPFVGLTR